MIKFKKVTPEASVMIMDNPRDSKHDIMKFDLMRYKDNPLRNAIALIPRIENRYHMIKIIYNIDDISILAIQNNNTLCAIDLLSEIITIISFKGVTLYNFRDDDPDIYNTRINVKLSNSEHATTISLNIDELFGENDEEYRKIKARICDNDNYALSVLMDVKAISENLQIIRALDRDFLKQIAAAYTKNPKKHVVSRVKMKKLDVNESNPKLLTPAPYDMRISVVDSNRDKSLSVITITDILNNRAVKFEIPSVAMEEEAITTHKFYDKRYVVANLKDRSGFIIIGFDDPEPIDPQLIFIKPIYDALKPDVSMVFTGIKRENGFVNISGIINCGNRQHDFNIIAIDLSDIKISAGKFQIDKTVVSSLTFEPYDIYCTRIGFMRVQSEDSTK